MADENLNPVKNMNNINDKRSFICGVVEGFYGRPWTPEQRKDLFAKQQKWEMNCYLYAPKDDYKHRSFWRDLYTVEEAEHLTALIKEAQTHNVTFYYAISPGLDITYSSRIEILALKRKLEQVQQLGCNAFAILFDDIDPEMSSADKEVFQSFAQAQVAVTNDIFSHLSQPKFMFCPTQYCSTRAVPSVATSEYLNTLGSKLAPQIDIMWTGPKVISKVLTTEHIQEVTDVLKRPPVIWDNLHANDYDQARVFLGPYCGRSPDLIRMLRGVVTNPNCEYGPNFIAIHTLAQWSRSSNETYCDNDAVSADIRLETEGDDSNDDCPSGLSASAYHPRRALRLALQEWLSEFLRPTQPSGPLCQPQIPTPGIIVQSVNTCMSVTSTTSTVAPNVNVVPDTINDSSFNPTMNPVMNSLVSENKVIVDDVTSPASQDTVSSEVEPMDCNPSPVHSTDSMVIEPKELEEKLTNGHQDVEIKDDISEEPDELCLEDLQLLADLFYLPFEHGKQGLTVLNEFNWLKVNSHLVIGYNRNGGTLKPEIEEWFNRADKFREMNGAVKRMSNRLLRIQNRSLLYDLYPYLSDMRGTIGLLNSYVEWLGSSKGWREVFMSGDQEPWVFRGGLTAELQRLIPVDASNDLFAYKMPATPLTNNYVIRPYMENDRQGLYNIILRTSDDGEDGTPLFTEHPNLPGDMIAGSHLENLKDTILMVVEDDLNSIVGYCIAEPTMSTYYPKRSKYLESIRERYPKVDTMEATTATRPYETPNDDVCAPESVLISYPALIKLGITNSLVDESVTKRLLTCVVASLRALGVFGGHVVAKSEHKNLLDLYGRLGFREVFSKDSFIILGRTF